MLVRKGGGKHEMFLRWSNSFRSWEGLSCSYRQRRHVNFFFRLFGDVANESQIECIFGLMVVCEWMANISGKHACWRGLVTLANRSCWYLLFVVVYVCWWDGMGRPCDRTVQDILVSNERGDAKSHLVIGLPVLISELNEWLQFCLGIQRIIYFDNLNIS